jgi:hypothetical protein
MPLRLFWLACAAVVFGGNALSEPDEDAVTGEAAATAARFKGIAVFSGSFPHREPWSPSGSVLLFNGGDAGGLWAFDVADPERGTWRLTDKDVGYLSWSPDGTWIVGKFRSGAKWWRREHLIAFPVTGDGNDGVELPVERDFGHFTWAVDGGIYYWTRGPEPTRIEPPAAWLDQRLETLSIQDHFVLVPRPHQPSYRPRLWPCAFMEVDGDLRVVSILVPFHGTSHFYVQDAFPDGERLLATITVRDRGSLYFVVNLKGDVLSTFDQKGEILEDGWWYTGFSPHSVSSDGKFLAGYRMEEDGHYGRSCAVYVSDVQGNWLVPIEAAPPGYRPQLSREGYFLAISSCFGGTIHVGELEIAYPE